MAIFTLIELFFLFGLIALGQSIAITGPSTNATNGTNGVNGVNGTTGLLPSRPEFSKFRASGPAFDLYILALQQFYQQDQTQLLSYYRVAGIHGYPHTPWDNVTYNYDNGYCTHGSILFPSWHRPYMALYEQILWNNAVAIARTYPNTSRYRYVAAANSFRIPYWDWAMNATMPDPVNNPQISVNGHQGRVTIDNPLYTYTFHPLPTSGEFPPGDPLSTMPSTVRYPDANGNSQPDLANAQLQANAQSLHDMTYQLIADQSNYAPFSNTGYDDRQGGSYNSLENMHNTIHSLVGNGGHMGEVPFAAFDPIFWLHHTNVDRLFAIYQAIWPTSYTSPEVTVEGTATNAPGSTEDINTPLTPFHDNTGAFYTSSTARSTQSFGYSYSDVGDTSIPATQLSSNVRSNLNALYNPTGSIATRRRRRSLTATNSTLNNSTYTASGATDHEYFVNIRVNKAALARSFFVHFFLGPAPLSPSAWSSAPNLIATHSVLFNPQSPTTTPGSAYGQIPLNHALLAPSPLTSPLPSLQPDIIIPFLDKALEWKIQLFDDSVVATDDARLRSLEIFVAGREVRKAGGGGDEFPVYGPVRYWRGVGKWGAGLSAGEGGAGTKVETALGSATVGVVASAGAKRRG